MRLSPSLIALALMAAPSYAMVDPLGACRDDFMSFINQHPELQKDAEQLVAKRLVPLAQKNAHPSLMQVSCYQILRALKAKAGL